MIDDGRTGVRGCTRSHLAAECGLVGYRHHQPRDDGYPVRYDSGIGTRPSRYLGADERSDTGLTGYFRNSNADHLYTDCDNDHHYTDCDNDHHYTDCDNDHLYTNCDNDHHYTDCDDCDDGDNDHYTNYDDCNNDYDDGDDCNDDHRHPNHYRNRDNEHHGHDHYRNDRNDGRYKYDEYADDNRRQSVVVVSGDSWRGPVELCGRNSVRVSRCVQPEVRHAPREHGDMYV